MSSRSKKNRDMLKKRAHSLEVELASLQPGQHAYQSNKRMLEQQLKLAKAELAPPKKSKSRKSRSSAATTTPTVNSGKTGKNTPKTGTGAAPKAKRSPLPGGASFPSFQLPSPKSPTFYEDSLKTVGSLRNLCNKAMGYIQRADQLFGSLHGVGNQLHEAGVLPKIMSGKFKDMSTGEWGTLLMALMQSPLSGMLLGGGGQGGETEGQPQALPEGGEGQNAAPQASHTT